jgi:5-methylthioribose kinase
MKKKSLNSDAAAAATDYVAHTVGSLPGYLAAAPGVGRKLGGSPDRWRVREVGDGNLNLVFIVTGPEGAVVVKQALPYLRCVGEGWPLTLDRAWFEYEALVEEARHARKRVPAVYHFDRKMALLVMEYLTPHIILRKGLIAGKVFPLMARHVGEFMAETLFKTSDFFVPAAQKKERMALFCQNTQLCKITEDLIFTDPYREAPHNRHTTPQLDSLARAFRQDGVLKINAQELKYAFLTHAEAMVHGDLHTGSIMVTEADTRAIDPEFAFYGPMGFDIGAVIGNLLLAWCSQPGHAAKPGQRDDYRRWILAQTDTVWSVFSARFSSLWRQRMKNDGRGDAFVPGLFKHQPEASQAALEGVLRHIWRDTLGFAGMKMIRRIFGLAHVEDFESIRNPDVRAACEGRALRLARRMVIDRAAIPSLPALLALVETELSD